jgi:methylenetetrahydrofolate dehydrogenase (NADP+)/methenyltetrahydrofolate cyclohydrolase
VTAKIIDGKIISQQIRDEIKKQREEFENKTGIKPGLAVILVGENPASVTYVGMKKKACAEVGFYSEEHKFNTDISEEKLLALINKLNNKKEIHGILVQLPLPKHISEQKVLNLILPTKDVDGFHPVNVGKLVTGDDCLKPCTPAGVQELLIRSGVETKGAHIVIVGRSNIVGKPLAVMLMQKAKGADATVTVCHSKTKNIAEITRQADILIAAIGSPLFIKKDMVKNEAVVIDVGVNRVDDDKVAKGYKLVGDVDYVNVKDVASAITPVPGGVGPMTVTMLMKNTLKAAMNSVNSI